MSGITKAFTVGIWGGGANLFSHLCLHVCFTGALGLKNMGTRKYHYLLQVLHLPVILSPCDIETALSNSGCAVISL